MKKEKAAFAFGLCILVICFFPVLAYADDSSHWWDAFGWFGNVANFIKYLVVPPENYWHNRLAKLNGLINAKFSGLGQLYQTLSDFFWRLSDPASGQLIASIPDNFFFDGYRGFSMDFFGAATPYIRFLRSFLSAGFFLFTIVVCYHKLRSFFTERE